jgi:hypothetical protein
VIRFDSTARDEEAEAYSRAVGVMLREGMKEILGIPPETAALVLHGIRCMEDVWRARG